MEYRYGEACQLVEARGDVVTSWAYDPGGRMVSECAASTIMPRTVGAAASGAAEGAFDGARAYVAEPGPYTPEGLLAAGTENALIGAATAGITANMPPWLSVEEMKCFDNWIYRSRYTTEPTVMFRAGDVNGSRTGNWWSTDAPLSVSVVRAEKALPPVWSTGDRNILNTGFSAELPAGLSSHVGSGATA
ncbi:hypothetical protein [Rathayibacter agropyri]|uniref:hypothetical protein n=1 Tax=Rathayibacter agropyri TaxID=1634927 RepID=UPI001FE8F37C|nr:hypothetical protein [Rathayibacter agropyri]